MNQQPKENGMGRGTPAAARAGGLHGWLALLAVSMLGAGCATASAIAVEQPRSSAAPTWEVDATAWHQGIDATSTLLVRVQGYNHRGDIKLLVRRCPDGVIDPPSWAHLPDDFLQELRHDIVANVELTAPGLDQAPPDADLWLSAAGERRVSVHLAPGKYFLTVELGQSAPAIALLEPVALAAGESKEVPLNLRAAVPWEIDFRLPDGSPALGRDQPGLLQVGGERYQRLRSTHPFQMEVGNAIISDEVRYPVQTFGGTPTEATLWCAWGANGHTVSLVREDVPSWKYDRTLTATMAPVRRVQLSLEPVLGGSLVGSTCGAMDLPAWWTKRWSGAFESPRSVRTLGDETTVFLRAESDSGVLQELTPSPRRAHLREWFTVSGDDIRLAGDGAGRFVDVELKGQGLHKLTLVPHSLPLPDGPLEPHVLGWFEGSSTAQIWIPDSAAALAWESVAGPRGRAEAPGAASIVIP